MALFDNYSDSLSFPDNGGLLGRLRAMYPQLAPDQPDAGFDRPASVPVRRLATLSNGGRPAPAAPPVAPDLHSQYQALRPILGDHAAMLATVHPEVGKTLIAQALAGRPSDNSANVVQAGYRLGGIPLPPMTPVPVPPIPMPSTPDWLKQGWQLYLRAKRGGGGGSGRGRRGDDEEDECSNRHAAETQRCDDRYDDYAHQDFLAACKERAKIRWDLCNRNGGRIPKFEPPEWGPADEEIWFNQNR